MLRLNLAGELLHAGAAAQAEPQGICLLQPRQGQAAARTHSGEGPAAHARCGAWGAAVGAWHAMLHCCYEFFHCGYCNAATRKLVACLPTACCLPASHLPCHFLLPGPPSLLILPLAAWPPPPLPAVPMVEKITEEPPPFTVLVHGPPGVSLLPCQAAAGLRRTAQHEPRPVAAKARLQALDCLPQSAISRICFPLPHAQHRWARPRSSRG